jgi:hypothetical protein
MYALNNLMKLNDLKDKHVEFEKLSAQQLELYREKYLKMVDNKKMVDFLPDKGEKIQKQLEIIKVIFFFLYELKFNDLSKFYSLK